MTDISGELRQAVIERASGRCEYCHIARVDVTLKFEVDHIIAEKHRGQTQLDNLCFACMPCNRHKGTDVASYDPESNTVVLFFNPRTMRWLDHFKFDGVNIVGITPIGQATVFLTQTQFTKAY